jgi:hypothetical protein
MEIKNDQCPQNRALAIDFRTAAALLRLFICTLIVTGTLPAFAAPASVAFYYGSDTSLDELHAFEAVVVDPDQGFSPQAFNRPGSELYAYVSVGEIHASRPWAGEVKKDWQLTTNTVWQSRVMDQRNADWRQFFIERVVAPLWQQGYRGFFLDTLDSWQLGGKAADPVAQQAGLVTLIRGLRERFPGIRLIANRGFELLPQVAGELEAVAAESLFQRWNQASGSYSEVPQEDREWLLARLREVHEQYHLPVIVIDYVAPTDRDLMRKTAQSIHDLGFIPWVSSGSLNTLGRGDIEVIPRRILMVFNSNDAPGMHYRAPHRYVEPLLNYLGFIADYVDATKPLPEPDPGVYAGIVTWFDRNLPATQANAYSRWLERRIQGGWHIALFETAGLSANNLLAPLGLQIAPVPSGKLEIETRNHAIGFEAEPLPNRQDLQPLRLVSQDKAQSWLRLHDARGNQYDTAGITPWGGFVWRGYTVNGDDDNGFHWVIDPWKFLQQTLALKPMPVADSTSDAGRRMFFTHMDGDGFPSRAEFPGSPYAAQVVIDEILRRYPTVPYTMSVIEGETSPQGLYPKESPALEALARKIFALPNVEIATHTFSHPFRWAKVEAQDASEDADADYHLAIPGYVPSLKREVDDSVEYIRTRLAPPDKPVKILLWSGDAAPTPSTLAYVENRGLLNMNGGSTMPTRAFPSLTGISPLGARLGRYFQVFAPETNENVYTNLWHGPFYGFRRVTETFEITGAPRRIKPVDIYFHTYAASKPASLRALQSAYDWALGQPLRPLFASDFIRKADAFNHVVLARNLDGDFLVANAGALRSLRTPPELGEPKLETSSNLAGWGLGPDGRYLILTAGQARFAFAQTSNTLPYLAGSNAGVEEWTRNTHAIHARLAGFAPIEFDLANAMQCTVKADGKSLVGTKVGQFLKYRLSHATATLDISCR